jgi:hypothetical protein
MRAPLVLALALVSSCSLVTSLDDLATAPQDGGTDVSGETSCSPNTDTDPANCGRCNHSCLGGTCTSGKCDPIVLASGQPNVFGLAVGNGYVYWSAYGAGAVKRCPVAGCGASPQTIAQVSGSLTMGLVIDSKNAYFSAKVSTNVTLGTVYSVPLDGSAAPTPLVTNLDHPVWLGIDTTSVYWANWGDGRIMSCPLGSSCPSPQTIHTQTGGPNAGPNGIASTGTAVYWVSDDGSARRCAIGNCATPVVFATGLSSPQAIVVDVVSTYWTNQVGSSVQKCQLSGCNNSPTLVASNEPGAEGIAVDTSGIYWTDSTGGLVRMCPATGCGAGPITLASGLAQPANVVLDDQAVYVSVYGTPNNGDGSVVKIPK